MDEPATTAPNVVWAIDPQHDVDERCKAIKISSIVDAHIDEYLGRLVERSITADRLIDHLEEPFNDCGSPAVFRNDNGMEYICEALVDWAGTRTGLSYIPPEDLGGMGELNHSTQDFAMSILTSAVSARYYTQVVTGDWTQAYHHVRRYSWRGNLAPVNYARSCTHQLEETDPHNAWISRRG